MKLFSNADVEKISATGDTKHTSLTTSFDISGAIEASALESFEAIKKHLSGMSSGDNKLFFSDGSWSNYELMEYLLALAGPALVGFTTWSISEVAITRMKDLRNSGQIIDLYAVLDVGIRNRKPHIYQHAISTISNLKLSHCHAKVLAIVGPEVSFLVVGSANFTKNPRKEAGVIICCRSAAEFSFNWIKNIVEDGSSA